MMSVVTWSSLALRCQSVQIVRKQSSAMKKICPINLTLITTPVSEIVALWFVSEESFETFSEIEFKVKSLGQIYHHNSFEESIESVSQARVLKFFCDQHREMLYPWFIREYIGVRFHFESIRLKNEFLNQSKANVILQKKLSKYAY